MQEQQPIYIQLTDEQLEKIADKAIEKLYARVGKTVIRRALWLLGLAAGALLSAGLAILFDKGNG